MKNGMTKGQFLARLDETDEIVQRDGLLTLAIRRGDTFFGYVDLTPTDYCVKQIEDERGDPQELVLCPVALSAAKLAVRRKAR